jgi:CotS family spore coat protein
LEVNEVKDIVSYNYNIDADSIEKIKGVYKIKADKSTYCLKLVTDRYCKFVFIVAAIKHLQNNGFNNIPQIIKNVQNMDYVKVNDKYAYFTKWVEARESNYNDYADVSIAANTLAKLHLKSEGFNTNDNMELRIGWNRWFYWYENKINDLYEFKQIIESKNRKTDFDKIYLENMKEELDRANNALNHLKATNYFDKMAKERLKRSFCHHDFANHNVLIDSNRKVTIIDFDYTILDTHLHDLSSLLLRRMKYGKWNLENAVQILESYDEVYPIEKDDIPIMAAFMEFPQDYWQRGIQYYREMQRWGEEFFIKKMSMLLNDKVEKQQ